MIAYLIKLTLCSGLLLAVYYLLLEKEKMHKFNRFYLLAAVIFSFIIPLVSVRVGTITVIEDPSPIVFGVQPSPVTEDTPAATNTVETAPTIATQSSGNLLTLALLGVYCLVTLVLLFRFTGTIIRLWFNASRALGLRYKNAKLVLLKEKTATHTFLNTIFVSHNDYEGNNVNEEVLTHEWAHVKQKHSLDVLFIELVKSIVWFNPFFILYKRAIQLNHEFLADDAVVHAYNDVFAYQHLLLDKISLASSHNLSSRLNFLITKKRLAMMTQEKNNKRAAIKTIIVATLMTGAFFLFVEKTYAQIKDNTQVKKDSANALVTPDVKDSLLKVHSVKVVGPDKVMGFTTPPKVTWRRGSIHGNGVTQEQFDEYEKAVNSAYKIKTTPDGTQYFEIDVTGLDINHLLSIFQNMSREQQWKATLLVGRIPYYPPPAKNPPTAEQFKQWADPKYAGVWIGNKRIANSDLGTKYKPSEFALWDQSLLGKGAYNYGKHKYQVNLYTHEDYAKSYPETVIHANSVKQEGNTIILK